MEAALLGIGVALFILAAIVIAARMGPPPRPGGFSPAPPGAPPRAPGGEVHALWPSKGEPRGMAWKNQDGRWECSRHGLVFRPDCYWCQRAGEGK